MEEKGERSKLSYAVIIIGALITVGIIVFFLVRMVTGNPLDGTWYNSDADLQIEFGDEVVTVTGIDQESKEEIQLEFSYTIQKDSKIVAFSLKKGSNYELMEITRQVFSGNLTGDGQKTISTQFEYSISGNVLTLMERDYGETVEFTRR